MSRTGRSWCHCAIRTFTELLCAAGLALVTGAVTGEEPSSLTFEREVRPILKAHCFQCHGEEPEPKGGLDLRLVRLMLHGGESGPAVEAGALESSLLWQRIVSDEMPAGDKKLGERDKQIIRDWIVQGARTARDEPLDPADSRFTEEELSFWAFQPLRSSPPPRLPGVELQSPIDAFIAQQLQRQGRSFSPPADRRTLIRRLSFDLLGLPPTPAEVEQFVRDPAPDAWERLIDRMLTSPQYGVRWGRHWLDVAGYAESDGNQGTDRPRLHAWHYRDYVVEALNVDKGYDQFVIEQLAGDELPASAATENAPAVAENTAAAAEREPDRAAERVRRQIELLSATGFLRMPPDVTETDDTIADRNQAVAETMKVIGSAFLGLTVGCAQCHDHRYDPISIHDYYQLRAVFDPAFPLHAWRKPSQRLVDLTDEATRAEIARIDSQAAAIEQDIQRRKREHAQTIQDRELNAAPAELRDTLRTAVNTPAAEQTAEQRQLLDLHPTIRTLDWIVGQLIEYDMPAYRRFEVEEKQVAELRQTKPWERLIMTVGEQPAVTTTSVVFFRGDPQQPKESVEPAELYALTRHRSSTRQPSPAPASGTSGRRLAYARQLTDGTHPLVARVAVNRIWMHHFGRGIVATPGDFGLFGERPTHPELLDWLADDFVRHGWSTKRLHRLLLTSRTYQQSSKNDSAREPDRADNDPDNRWLGRMSLRRMEAEVVRDSLLMVSEHLNLQLSGPSVPVSEDPEGKAVIGKRAVRDGLLAGIEAGGAQEFRRSLYVSTPRALPLTVLDTFDLPAMTPNCQRRDITTTAAQSLWFLNDQTSIECADRMATELCRVADDPPSRVQIAFDRLYAVEPADDELQQCLKFMRQQAELFRHDPDAEWQKQVQQDPAAVERRALASLCQILMAANRFLYIE